MSLLFKDLIFTACEAALVGVDPKTVAGIDCESIAESLIPEVLQAVGEMVADDEDKRSLLQREKTIAMVAGVGTIPNDVLINRLDSSVFYNPANLLQKYSWSAYDQFRREAETRLGWFANSSGVIVLMRQPGEVFSTTLTFTGDVRLLASCKPLRPATADDPIGIPVNVESDTIKMLTAALKSQPPFITATAKGT